MKVDALTTTLASEWEGLEAIIIHEGVYHTTDEFERHVLDT
jgi:thiamine biosynthesis lipoprotein